VSSYYANDRLGNLWTRDPASGKSQLTYEDFSGFGTSTSGGAAGSPFGFGGANGCQTDADTGLVLMGHRYYDPRIGRFLSQDHTKSGRNWYAYAGNNPTNKTDPTGLSEINAFAAPSARGQGPVGDYGFMSSDQLDSLFGTQNNVDLGDIAEQVQQTLAASIGISAGLGLLGAVSAVAPQMDWVFNLTLPSISVSAGPIHLDASLGIAIQGPGLGATGWGLETYGSGNVGLGIGLGVSVSPGKPSSIGFGVGNLNGFNGASWFGTIGIQPLFSLTYSQAMAGGYKGIQLGLPLGGIDVGLYGGAGYTVPIFSVGKKN